MKLAVSNLAWPVEVDDAAGERLTRLGVAALEIAPTRWWPDPTTISPTEAKRVGQSWAERGLPIVAVQSLLFGRPELKLFADRLTRSNMLDYLARFLEAIRATGADRFVFGSPKNRRIDGPLDKEELSLAIDFFTELGEAARRVDAVVVLEANPVEYGADFLTTSQQAYDFVRRVNHPGIRLHLDIGCMTLAGDDPCTIIPPASDWIAHCHASEPYLLPIGTGATNHTEFAAALQAIHYSQWVSVEMLPTKPFEFSSFERAVQYAIQAYGGVAD